MHRVLLRLQRALRFCSSFPCFLAVVASVPDGKCEAQRGTGEAAADIPPAIQHRGSKSHFLAFFQCLSKELPLGLARFQLPRICSAPTVCHCATVHASATVGGLGSPWPEVAHCPSPEARSLSTRPARDGAEPAARPRQGGAARTDNIFRPRSVY